MDSRHLRGKLIIRRLSIPNNYCRYCDAKIGKSIVCPGCKWVDPPTGSKPPPPPEQD